jgi:hypothetical protein
MNDAPSYRCPHCQYLSHSVDDMIHLYCVRCHRYADDEQERQAHLELMAEAAEDDKP